MYDLSDEATGLPPLDQIDPADSFFVAEWMLGAEGLVSVADSDAPVPVMYLSLRGLALDEEGEVIHSQLHVALPHQAVRPLLEQMLAALEASEAD